ncbi:MAG: GTP-binding protein [Lachnotalea sp.]
MEKPIELYLISGFLGSGKTTFLRNMLIQSKKERIGVIVNEFGNIGIDGKIISQKDIKLVEINNGSIFCACLKGGFVKTLAAFLEQPIDCLYVEASGMADPSSINKLLEELPAIVKRKNNIDRNYEYKGGICIVDAKRFLKISQVIVAAKNQVEKSDFLVVNKIDQVLPEDIQKVHESLEQIHPGAYIYDTSYAEVPIEVMRKYVIPIARDYESVNLPTNRLYSCTLSLTNDYKPEKMVEFIKLINKNLIRAKGFFKFKDILYHLECVTEDIEIEEFSKEEENISDLCIVIIGKNEMDLEEEIKAMWNKVFETDLPLLIE